MFESPFIAYTVIDTLQDPSPKAAEHMGAALAKGERGGSPLNEDLAVGAPGYLFQTPQGLRPGGRVIIYKK